MIDHKQADKALGQIKRKKVPYDVNNMNAMSSPSLHDDIFFSLDPIIPDEKDPPLDKVWESTKLCLLNND